MFDGNTAVFHKKLLECVGKNTNYGKPLAERMFRIFQIHFRRFKL